MADTEEKMVDLKDQSVDDLKSSLDRVKDELFRLKLGRVTNQLQNPMQIRAKRREIARIQTVLSARRKAAAKQG